MTTEQSKFLIELQSISREIAGWAEKQISSGCSVAEVKRKLMQIAAVAGRD